ncbi:hypothetical protein KEM52_000524 [Ascosphaera acerosa]|nr:hypothetical protein KEM52_000524 [Ascosphaera acerosa]
MSASPSPSSFDTLFRTVEHVAPAQHIREFPFATIKPDDTLHLAVKQYIPLENGAPQPGDVTIIGGHANGFPKELYEPLWEDLLVQSRGKFRIRSIWMADVAWQGQSGVLNEQKLGNDLTASPDPSVNLALTHPRLLHSIVLVDPVIAGLRITEKPKSYHGSKSAKPSFNILTTTQASTYRRDLWPSREAAAHSFRKSPFYKAWDYI